MRITQVVVKIVRMEATMRVRKLGRGGSRAGFTLVEVLIVVVVIGILAAIVAVNYGTSTGDARRAVAVDFERQLRNAVSMYVAKMGKPPSSFSAFMSYSDQPSAMSFLGVGSSIRSQFEDSGAMVGQNDGSIVFPFKGGATATYEIDASGEIFATYDGFPE